MAGHGVSQVSSSEPMLAGTADSPGYAGPVRQDSVSIATNCTNRGPHP
ncbi:MAG: hypothetical protein AVDCRST_MAG48-2888 [uncultured Friedmanniella sp.]|uniref:Uncharacterized protein n=1 Tax=uncultured Friedmanniella sp. TaxID=335381 RepID=A0A6J4L8K0_9ACTN|nr:MAG: hypothetical protein AVDCRST_MAG48-2888 [uncultured Friedmanniella sp.]